MDVVGLADQPGAYADASMDTREDLIARARRGDEDAFRLIFERYTRPVISFIFYMINDPALSEELAQETFVRAYKSLSALRDETKLSTWLFGIAKNVVRESLRESRRSLFSVEIDGQAALEILDERESPAGRLLDRELSSMVRQALLKLDEDKRLVFTLHGRGEPRRYALIRTDAPNWLLHLTKEQPAAGVVNRLSDRPNAALVSRPGDAPPQN